MAVNTSLTGDVGDIAKIIFFAILAILGFFFLKALFDTIKGGLTPPGTTAANTNPDWTRSSLSNWFDNYGQAMNAADQATDPNAFLVNLFKGWFNDLFGNSSSPDSSISGSDVASYDQSGEAAALNELTGGTGSSATFDPNNIRPW